MPSRCPVCDKCFTRRDSYEQHARDAHAPIKCPVQQCTKYFKSEPAQHAHMKDVHPRYYQRNYAVPDANAESTESSSRSASPVDVSSRPSAAGTHVELSDFVRDWSAAEAAARNRVESMRVESDVTPKHPPSDGLREIGSDVSRPESAADSGKYAALEHKTSDLPGPAISRETLPTPKVSPLHCRICRKDPCIDTTATMCGHIFCSRCITDEIVSTSRCPVCSTTTLLYCLFRLDLSR
ncbi:hypothetical protein PLICRDRAFT_38071 [Plicaturopsis crispa FD-325 SS-3]|nr:hypothetical protein PLICRDRAFT_38071 [Plicaturopsis crispa FD-325 SS-3]